MKTTLAFTYLAVASLLAPIAAIAADSDMDRSRPEAFVKDSAITTQVKTELAAQHLNSLAHISVDTDKNGVVWLSGTARTQEAIDLAVSTTRATKGVTSVHSTLTIKKDD